MYSSWRRESFLRPPYYRPHRSSKLGGWTMLQVWRPVRSLLRWCESPADPGPQLHNTRIESKLDRDLAIAPWLVALAPSGSSTDHSLGVIGTILVKMSTLSC